MNRPTLANEATTPQSRAVGSTIALQRSTHGLTIEELARRSSISTGLLSQLERGIGNPSLSTLTRLAQALDIPIGAFFAGSTDGGDIVVHPNTRKRLYLADRNLTYQLLVPDLQGTISMLHIEMPPRFTNEGDPFRHPGEECMLVLKGKIETHAEERTFLLTEGDSIRFASTTPHWYRTFGRGADLITAMTPPSL